MTETAAASGDSESKDRIDGVEADDDGFDLGRECETLTRYLIDQSPSHGVRGGYLRAHRLAMVAPREGATVADRATLVLARRGGLWTRLADVHARFFLPDGYLRRKLVLLLALLETDAAGRSRADRIIEGGRMALFFRILWWGIVSAGLLIVSVPVVMIAKRATKQVTERATKQVTKRATKKYAGRNR